MSDLKLAELVELLDQVASGVDVSVIQKWLRSNKQHLIAGHLPSPTYLHLKNGLIDAVRARREPDGNAVRRLGAMVQIAESFDDAHFAACCRGELADRLENLGHWEEAAEAHKLALAVFARSDYNQALKERGDLMFCLRRAGLNDAALDQIEQQKSEAMRLNRPEAVVDALLQQSFVLRQAGRPGAIPAAEEAVKRCRALGPNSSDRPTVRLGTALRMLAIVARQEGEHETSQQALIEALAAERGDPGLEALTLSELAYTCHSAGDLEKALQYIERAASQGKGHRKEAERWLAQARLWSAKAKGARLPLPSATAIDGPEVANFVQTLLMDWLRQPPPFDVDELQIAENIGRDVLNWALRARILDIELIARTALGFIALHRGDVQMSIHRFWRVIALLDRQKRWSESFKARYHLAQAFYQKNPGLAGDVILHAIINGFMVLKTTGSSAMRQSVSSDLARLYHLYATIAAPAGEWDQLVWYTEQSRGRNLRDWVRAVESARAIGRSAATERALSALRSLEVELEARSAAETLDWVKNDRLRRRREVVLRKLEHLLPGYRGFRDPLTEPFASSNLDGLVRPWVRDDTAVLYLYLTRDGISAARCPVEDSENLFSGCMIECDHAGLRDTIGRWVRWLGDAQISASGVTARGLPAGSATLLESVLREFDTTLYQPLANMMQSVAQRSFVIVPHAELAYLPMWRLIDRLGADGSFSITPSLALYSICAFRERSTPGPVIIVGDESGTLRHAEDEIRLVKSRFEPLLIRTARSVSELKTASPEAALIHVAAHGSYNAANPYLSGLYMGEDGPQQGPFVRFVRKNGDSIEAYEPGCLRIFSVAECMSRLALPRCRLAVLSACETGISRLHRAEETTGLPAAFLLAGSKSVVASSWRVDDRATAVLMTYFYQHWSNDTSPSRALSLARGDLRRTSRSKALEILGSHTSIPDGDHPFDRPVYADAFACYGSL